MQAITIGIGKTGIQFFAQKFLSGQIVNLLKTLNPPDRTISIDSFSYPDGDSGSWTINNMKIELSNGSMVGYGPAYQGIAQGQSGGVAVFTLSFAAGAFTAAYAWQESYDWVDSGSVDNNGHDYPYHRTGQKTNEYDYAPAFSALSVQVVVQFTFNPQAKAWEVTVKKTSGNATAQDPNIPKKSVLQNQTDGNCSFSSHVDYATTQSIDSIDFATPVNKLISGILATIPGSGNLGDGITYDFSMGDSGPLFPDNDGIQMGVKGGASYNGSVFSSPVPPSLPLPTPPGDTDTHHLNIYVSNYEVDALQWAFYEAGKLNGVVTPDELSDPNVLKMKTYYQADKALIPYKNCFMNAHITLNAAPVSSFQMVYELSTPVMALLQTQLPAAVYNQLSYLQGNNYTSLASLESDLSSVGITNQETKYCSMIEAAAKSMGMVVMHDINFKLVVHCENLNPPDYPVVIFNVRRTDILGALALGLGPGNTQTMQFNFTNVEFKVSFVSSTIPHFDGTALSMIWQNAGENNYAGLLKKMGTTGVPIPIMAGFQFDFTNAVLSVQEGYVSILANVQYP